MTEYDSRICLGSAPAEEYCVQMGERDYQNRASRQCEAFLQAIRRTCGTEPEGARLRILADAGVGLDVFVEYDSRNRVARDYADHCDNHLPATWHEAGMVAPNLDAASGGKRYVGERTPQGVKVTVHTADGNEYPLDPRYDLRRHSPDGFEFGYAGSGPSQLSLALLADALGDDDKAREHYQAVKFKVIAKLDGDRFEMSQDDVKQAVEKLGRGRGWG